ncbi:hypothetical protein [Nocardioides sp. GY 10127]|uniref:hypothetical protein n=1 Tax=Nocardioides sp. GY 10127 TaxID=2569762 RepID=UPI0010A772E6|nr:hypothetical protein [Nocardioides sp. GY 10127]TIC82833.1 hypothetical protein E8D37_09190 [Nocardioides sp. GY 10127]
MRLPNPLDPVNQLLDLLPRAFALLPGVESLLDRIEGTRLAAEELIARIEVTRQGGADLLVGAAGQVARIEALVDVLEPRLTELTPVLDRLLPLARELADTTSPEEVAALVRLIDQLPEVAESMETEVMPVLTTLGTVAPDVHDLLGVARELNELLTKVPGMGRVKRRVDEEQAERGIA